MARRQNNTNARRRSTVKLPGALGTAIKNAIKPQGAVSMKADYHESLATSESFK